MKARVLFFSYVHTERKKFPQNSAMEIQLLFIAVEIRLSKSRSSWPLLYMFLNCDSSVSAITLGQSMSSQAVGMELEIYFLHIAEIKGSPY